MSEPSDPHAAARNLREQIIGLSERSLRKSYFPQLQQQIIELKDSKAFLERNSAALLKTLAQLESERLRAEESEQNFRTLFNEITDGIVVVDASTKQVCLANPAMGRMLGYSDNEIERLHVSDIHPREELPRVMALFERQVRGEIKLASDMPVKRKNGAIFYADINASIVKRGEQQLIIGVFHDITERKQTEEALRESKQMLSNVLENFPGIVFWKNRESVFLGCNKAFAKASGLNDPSQIAGKTDHDCPWKSEEEAYRADDRKVMESGEPKLGIIEPFFRADGQMAWLDTSKVPIFDASGRVVGVLGTSHDITDIKNAEAALILRNRQLEILARASQQINTVLEIPVVLRALVSSALNLTGAEAGAAGQLIGSKMVFTEYNRAGITHPIDYAFDEQQGVPGHVMATRQPYLSNNAQNDPHVNREAQQALQFHNLANVPIFNRHAELLGCIEIHNKPENFDDRDLLMLKSLAASAAIAFENAQMLAARQQAEDALRRAHDELEQRVQERTRDLVLANKELESFAYAASHDLRAPLRGIDGWSQLLLEEYGSALGEQAINYLEAIRSRSQRMSQLIEALLKFSMLACGELQRQQVNLSNIIQEIADRLSKDEPDRKVEFIIAPGILAQADPELIRPVLENLMCNAWKFTGKCINARIEFGVTRHKDKPACFIRDNGAGFNMEQAAKLFTPFRRLHHASDFPGTGIGLATVQRIIHRHSGQVWAESAVDQGTTFYFTLP